MGAKSNFLEEKLEKSAILSRLNLSLIMIGIGHLLIELFYENSGLKCGIEQSKKLFIRFNILPSHPPQPIWAAGIDWTVNPDYGVLTVKAKGIKQEINLSSRDRPTGIARMLDTLVAGETKVVVNLADISIVGHRVVHGGTEYSQATMITPQVKETIKKLIPLAPSHNPAHLEGIEAIEQILGDVPQVAVFDTAFHRSIPPESSLYPIPYQWSELGIRRYGFHGTSHQSLLATGCRIVGKTPRILENGDLSSGKWCFPIGSQEG
jgi:acetate kinase